MNPRDPVVVIGTANVDLRLRVTELPRRGETVLARSFDRTLGGKGANQAIAAHRSGAKVRLVSSIADNPDGKWLRSQMVKCGVAAHWVDADRTGVAIVAVDHRGENQIIVSASNMPAAPLNSILRETIADDSIVLVQRELGSETVTRCLKAARSNGATTILNAAPAVDVAEAELSLADYLIVNEVEFESVFGVSFDSDSTWDQAMPSTTVVTLGRRGVAVLTSTGTRYIPGHTVTSVDTVGAGDTFCGAFTAALSAGTDAISAVQWGQAVAALSCTREGAAEAIPSHSEVSSFLMDADPVDVTTLDDFYQMKGSM